jgi:hypothetical protein
MKRLLSFLALCAVSAAFLAPRAQAQVAFVPYLGYDLDANSLLLGVGAEFGMLPGALPVALTIRPSAEYFFLERERIGGIEHNVTLLQFNGDVIAQLTPPGAGMGLFAGAGVAVRNTTFSPRDAGPSSTSDTMFGFNLLGGVQFGTGFASPFVQARATFMDGGVAPAILGGVKLGL